MSQYADLKAQIAKLEVQAEELRRAEIAEVAASLREKIAEYGLSAADLGLGKGLRGRQPKSGAPKKTSTPVPPRYQDPKTGATWSGRGKPPRWIAGKNRDRFLIA